MQERGANKNAASDGALRRVEQINAVFVASEVLQLAAALQNTSDHRLAHAVMEKVGDQRTSMPSARLRELGIRTVMLTGDNKGSAHAVARDLDIDEVRAELLPGDKATIVQELRKQGHIVAMVGDGLNDAPSLVAADVGLSMSTGTDVAMEAAGITLMRGDPRLVADSFDVSRRTYSKIKQGLFWAFAYNIVDIPLAALGMLNPVIAGVAMAFSSVSVVSNALMLRRWRGAATGANGTGPNQGA